MTSHAAGCHMPEPMTDPEGFLHCPACGYVQPKPKASTQPSNYRCREHPDCSTTWKGTGCPRCATDRKRRKASPEPSDYTEMEY